jgi:hypothetical protein
MILFILKMEGKLTSPDPERGVEAGLAVVLAMMQQRLKS